MVRTDLDICETIVIKLRAGGVEYSIPPHCTPLHFIPDQGSHICSRIQSHRHEVILLHLSYTLFRTGFFYVSSLFESIVR